MHSAGLDGCADQGNVHSVVLHSFEDQGHVRSAGLDGPAHQGKVHSAALHGFEDQGNVHSVCLDGIADQGDVRFCTALRTRAMCPLLVWTASSWQGAARDVSALETCARAAELWRDSTSTSVPLAAISLPSSLFSCVAQSLA